MLPRLPLWENVTLGLVPLGRGVAERRRAAEEALGRLGLGERLRAAPETLSTGEMQRAALARALLGAPAALLVDEPLSNLDEAAARLVLEALEGFHRGGGTVVCATHGTAPFGSATGRVGLSGGRVV